MGEMNFMQQAMTAGKMKKAFEKSVELDPRHVAGLIGLSRYYSQAPEIAGGSLEKAREFAGRVREIVPFLGEIELGQADRQDEKYAEALGHFEAAARLKPDHAEAQILVGRMLAQLGRKDEARARFEVALKLNPQSESAKKGLAALAQPAG
jgi:cytochrome c-type biogenesis protein CcmH/NrfG